MAARNHKHDDDDTKSLFHKVQQTGRAVVVSLALFATLWPIAAVVHAADFAGMDISGQDFSNQDLQGKDFTSVVAKGTKFQHANLQGATFAKANLMQADFTNANLGQAVFVDAQLDGTIMKDVTAQKATFSSSILDVADFENADLTDFMWPSNLVRDIKMSYTLDYFSARPYFLAGSLTQVFVLFLQRIMICDMNEIKGTNKVTGVNSRESLMCIDYTRRS
jgi:uncharacterized protein YjbI with pentapeptide repeats